MEKTVTLEEALKRIEELEKAADFLDDIRVFVNYLKKKLS